MEAYNLQRPHSASSTRSIGGRGTTAVTCSGVCWPCPWFCARCCRKRRRPWSPWCPVPTQTCAGAPAIPRWPLGTAHPFSFERRPMQGHPEKLYKLDHILEIYIVTCVNSQVAQFVMQNNVWQPHEAYNDGNGTTVFYTTSYICRNRLITIKIKLSQKHGHYIFFAWITELVSQRQKCRFDSTTIFI